MNLDVIHMMDAGDTYYDEIFDDRPAPSLTRQEAAFPGIADYAQDYFWKYSTGVLISGPPSQYLSASNIKDRVTMTTFQSIGRCRYLLRDWTYAIDHSAYGRGGYPNRAPSAMAFYTRGNAYLPAKGNPPDSSSPAIYNRALLPNAYPNNTKPFFIGPVE